MKKRTRFGVDKLVRDRTLERCERKNILPKWRTLSGNEYLHELKKKLVEEAEEVLATNNEKDLIEELADVQEVINVLIEKAGIDTQQLDTVREDKKEKRGSFCKGIFVEHVDAIKDSKWADHYNEQPDKYPILEDDIEDPIE